MRTDGEVRDLEWGDIFNLFTHSRSGSTLIFSKRMQVCKAMIEAMYKEIAAIKVAEATR